MSHRAGQLPLVVNPIETASCSKDFQPGLFSFGFSLVTVAQLIQGDSEPSAF